MQKVKPILDGVYQSILVLHANYQRGSIKAAWLICGIVIMLSHFMQFIERFVGLGFAIHFMMGLWGFSFCILLLALLRRREVLFSHEDLNRLERACNTLYPNHDAYEIIYRLSKYCWLGGFTVGTYDRNSGRFRSQWFWS